MLFPFCSSSFSPLWAEGGWQFVMLIDEKGEQPGELPIFSELVNVPEAYN